MIRRRKRERCNIRPARLRVPGHGQYVRGFDCCVADGNCDGGIEAHHNRNGIPNEDRGGTSRKPHDKWLVPLCHFHHIEDFHRVGHDTFEAKHGIDLKAEASRLWYMSIHRVRYERNREKELANG